MIFVILSKELKRKIRGKTGILGIDEENNKFVFINKENITKEEEVLIQKETKLNLVFIKITNGNLV